MLPKVIIHNEVSVDGCIDGFDADIGLYYTIAKQFKPEAILVGSNTVKTAHAEIPPEEDSDLLKPELDPEDRRPFWVIPDSRGVLKHVLHFYRRMEFIKDIILLVSRSTPGSYLDYLEERQFDVIITGDDHVNYREALELLSDEYGIKTMITDSGGTLNNILIKEGLVDEISLLISPVLVGKGNRNLFRNLDLGDNDITIELQLARSEILDGNYLLLVYKLSKH